MDLDWNHTLYSDFVEVVCCFLIASSIWQRPLDFAKAQYATLFRRKADAHIAKIERDATDSRRTFHLEFLSRHSVEIEQKLDRQIDIIWKWVYVLSSSICCIFAVCCLFTGKTNDLGRGNAYLVLPIILLLVSTYIIYRLAVRDLNKQITCLENYEKVEQEKKAEQEAFEQRAVLNSLDEIINEKIYDYHYRDR